MKNNKIKEVLEKQISLVKPNKEEIKKLKEETTKIKSLIEQEIKKRKIQADVFIGGSLAKGTIIKKKKKDIDLFVRFSRKYKDKELSKLLDKVVMKYKNKFKILKVHGSRDYFQINLKTGKLFICFEIIPVSRIKKAEEARNVTDLSVLHVKYINNKTKNNENLRNGIMLAKSFCYGQGVYGAESYIGGFSGYALELLVSYYGSFLEFIKTIADSKISQNEKIIIDPAKFYKNKEEIMLNLNESKLQSPIVFIDPTFKQRNALAALSVKSLLKFKDVCTQFLKKPSLSLFKKQEVDLAKLKKEAKIRKAEFFMLQARTNRPAADVAGSKLLKFFNLFTGQVEKYFTVLRKDFAYNEGKQADFYFILQRKKQIIISGPPITSPVNLTNFKKTHKNCFIKQGRAYAREKADMSASAFFNLFKKQNKKRIREMGITSLKIKK